MPKPDCPACQRLERIRSGDDPELLADLPESYAVLGDCQRWPGWCTLFLKDHHEHLADLSPARQARLAARATRSCCCRTGA